MYHEEMVSIGKIENGYIIEVRVPYKEDEDDCLIGSRSKEKKFHVADVEAMAEKLMLLLPALEDKEDAEAAFKKSFKEATNDERE